MTRQKKPYFVLHQMARNCYFIEKKQMWVAEAKRLRSVIGDHLVIDATITESDNKVYSGYITLI